MIPDHSNTNWKKRQADIFWSEIVPCHHVVQLYENDKLFLEGLANFVEGGVKAADSSIVVATRNHLNLLHAQLGKRGFNIEFLVSQNIYIPLDADEVLAKFMVNGVLNETLFDQEVHKLFEKAAYKKRKIRAFGEMVAILWEKGLHDATIQLENLWNKVATQYSFCLFCAYPKSAFNGDLHNSMDRICKAHSKLIAESENQSTEIVFQDIG